MTGTPGLLDFFVLEASECVEQLDGLLAVGGVRGPDPGSFVRGARALRGAATMARLPAIAEVAAALERLGRGLQSDSTGWSYAVGGAATAAVDDLKILVRAVRGWSDADEQRAKARVAELNALVPAQTRALSAPTPAPSGGAFVAAQTLQISVALDAVVQRPTGRDALGLAMRRIRALHGVASIKDLPPLPEILDAIERTLQPIELGTAAPSAGQLALLSAAARALRRASQEIVATGHVVIDAPEVKDFVAAVMAQEGDAPDANHIVPVASLFYPDAGPHVVSEPHPPMTAVRRFRLEVVSLAEHVRRVVGDARRASDPMSRDRAGREVRAAIRAIQSAAASFGQSRIADFFSAAAVEAGALEPAALDHVDGVAALLADPAAGDDLLSERIHALIPPASAVPRRTSLPGTPRSSGAIRAPIVGGTPAAGVSTLDAAIGLGMTGRPDSRTPLGIPTTEPRLGEQMGFATTTPRQSGQVPVVPPAPRASTPAAPVTATSTPPRTPTPLAIPATPPTPPRVPTPLAVPALPPAARAPSPPPSISLATGKALQGALQHSIEQFADLDLTLLAEPTSAEEELVVPIQQLLYRGRSAVERARELCDDARTEGRALDRQSLEEMADLLVLALAE